MAKKRNPKDQTGELSRARWAFLQRNDKAKKAYEEGEAIRSLRKTREEAAQIINRLASDPKLSGKINPLEDFDAFLAKTQCSPAVEESVGLRQAYWNAYLGLPPGTEIADEAFNQLWKEQALADAKPILRELIRGQLDTVLVVRIDLTRTKQTIIAELEEILSTRLKGKQRDSRLKWLGVVDELLAVWDAWVKAGEPARQAFPVIAKWLHVPQSTVKARWYKAYELIYGTPYEIDPAKRREARTEKALELCLNCTNPTCGNSRGVDEIGCPAYERLAGKNTPREQGHDDIDMITERRSRRGIRKRPHRPTES